MRPPMTASIPVYEERAQRVNLPPRHADEPFIVNVLIHRNLEPFCLDPSELVSRRFLVTGKSRARFHVHRVDPLDRIPEKACKRGNGVRLVRIIQRAIEQFTGLECAKLQRSLVSDIFDEKEE